MLTLIGMLLVLALILAHHFHPTMRRTREQTRGILRKLEEARPAAPAAPSAPEMRLAVSPFKSRSRILATNPRMKPFRTIQQRVDIR